MSKVHTKAHLCIMGANLIFGLNYSIAKYLLNGYVKSMGLNVIRVAGAILLFGIVSFFIKEKIEKKDLKRLAFAGLLGIVINQVFFLKGLSYTTPIDSSIIMTASPIMVLLMSVLFLNEGIHTKKIIGTIIGFFGAILLIVYGGHGKVDFSNHTALGNSMQFINAFAYACYLIVVKPLMTKYHPITVLKYAYLFGSIIIFPIGFNEFSAISWASLPTQALLAMVYMVVFSSFLAFILNIFALRHLKASVVSSYVYSQPAIAAAFALLFGSDQLTWFKTIAALFVFFGVYLASQPEKEKLVEC